MTVTMTMKEYKELDQYKEKYYELKSCVKLHCEDIYKPNFYTIDLKKIRECCDLLDIPIHIS
ncbi:hypothetical protein FDF74_11425 [Clostridium niameyense]|uniref:Uncharacterized protein n=1 Tax=Clostridium niameyense TaxID=1622073 RepID=A0A6M0RBW0_9CLOT|nr:hypothetical protein [Clostridium niameyense]NEZ47791.1 hypothetical protein [Clostridium niameyense]